MKNKTIGLYLKLSFDDKKIVDELRSKYAINISQAFRLFLEQTLDRERKSREG